MVIENDFTVTFESLIASESAKVSECCRIRKLKIRNHLNNEERYLTHYNYLTWPDFGTPEESEYEVLEDIIDKIAKIEDDESNKSKIVVHCSAGIGRTGTLIAIYN